MKKRIITLIASLIVVIGLFASQASNAWFVTAVKRAQNITIGAVSYGSGDAVSLETMEADFYGRPCIYPGQNLVAVKGEDLALTMFNSSTIDTQVRVKIEYTSYADGVAKTVRYSADDTEDFEVTFAPGWAPYDNGMDGTYFYYVGGDAANAVLTNADDAFVITPDISSVAILQRAGYRSGIDAQRYSGNEVTVSIVFEAKQADYVAWSTLSQYQVSTSVDEA